jgi:phage terminase large subunit
LPVPFPYDWQNPDYLAVFDWRIERLSRIRANPDYLPALKAFYRDNPAQFVIDWGCTTDPRNVEVGRPVVLPFILFPRQVEWIDWVMDSWRSRRPGVNPKSRESGVSWLAVALSCTLCMLNDNMTIGFGSRKSELVDKIGDPDSLFWKAREFIALVPQEFRGSWSRDDAPEKRIKFPDTRSVIKGEGGDDIGRGGRCGIYFVDEAAFLAHPDLAEASLSQTTNCRIDISTPNGMGNPFHRKVTTWPADRVFRLHWRDDPRKDQAWYDKQILDLDNPVTIAQELDIDFSASAEGVLIPSAWVQAAIDAHVKLGLKPSGARSASLDVADEGKDLNAFCGAHGVLVELVDEWSGKGDDIFGTVQRAFGLCDRGGYDSFKYDSDGLGAGVRGDARVVNEGRTKKVSVEAFRGSAAVFNPEGEDVKGRKNQDMFANCKAQAWWSLRTRFQKTFRAVKHGVTIPPDELISLSPYLPLLNKLCAELSQPTYSINAVGKMLVDKSPDGTKSPNLADSVMITFSATSIAPMVFSRSFLDRI